MSQAALFNTVWHLAYLGGPVEHVQSGCERDGTIPDIKVELHGVPAVILAKVASDGGCSPRSRRAMTGCFIPTARASCVWVRPRSAR